MRAWATVVYMNMGETRAVARYETPQEAIEKRPTLKLAWRDNVVVTAKSDIGFLSVSALDALMTQFDDKRLGVKKERKEVIVKQHLSHFDPAHHDETGKLITPYENQEEEAMIVTDETPVTDGEMPTPEEQNGGNETPRTAVESGADELKEVVKKLRKRRAVVANDETPPGDAGATTEETTVKTTAKKKTKAKGKAKAVAKTAVKTKLKAVAGTGKKGFPYPAPDPESKAGKVLAYLAEQIKVKDIAIDEKAEKAELYERAAKKFEQKVITIRTYASDHRDKLKWRAPSKK